MIERIYLLFEIISTLLILWVLHGSKKKPGIYTIIYVCLELIIVSMVAEGFISSEYTLIAYVGIAIVDFIEFDDTLKESIIYMIIDCIIMFGLQVLGVLAYSVAFHCDEINLTETMVINFVLLLFCIISFRKLKIHSYIADFLGLKHIADVVIAILVVLLFLFVENRSNQIFVDWDLLVFLVLFSFVTILVCVKLIRERFQKNQYMERLQEYEKYNQVYKELISDIRHRQHDFDNHLQAFYSIGMSCDSIEEVRKEQCKYLNELQKQNKSYRLLKENVSSVLTAFLYIKFNEMEKQGVSVNYRIAIDQFDKCVPFPDIVELVGNLLDNAMEATKKTEYSKIYYYMEEGNNYINIIIENPYDWIDGERFDIYLRDGKSSNGNKRGFGLTNASRIIDRYQGLLEVKFDYRKKIKIIRFTITLPLKKEKH